MAATASKIPEESKPDIKPDLEGIRGQEGINTNSAGRGRGGSNTGTGGRPVKMSYGNKDKQDSPSKLKDSEENGGEPSGDDSADEDDGQGGLWSGDNENSTNTGGKAKTRFKLTRKKAAAGATGLFIVGAVGFGGLSITQGPLQVIHLGRTLASNMSGDENSSESRLNSLFRYGRYAATGNIGETRVGNIGSYLNKRVTTQLKEVGISYKSNPLSGIDAVEFDSSKLSERYPEIKNASRARVKAFVYAEMGVPQNTPLKFSPSEDGKGFLVSASTEKFDVKLTRAAVKGNISVLGDGKVISAMKLRPVGDFFGIKSLWHPVERATDNKLKKLGVKATRDAEERDRQERRRPPPTPEVTEAKNKLKDKLGSNRGKLSALLLTTAGMCLVRAVADSVIIVNRGEVVVPAAISAADKMAFGSQTERGDISAGQVGGAADSLVDKDGNSVWKAKALLATADPSSTGGTEISPAYKQAFVKDTSAENIKNTAGGGKVGAIACSPGGQLVQITATVFLVVTGFVDGGASWAALAAKEGASTVASAGAMYFIQTVLVDALKNDAVFPKILAGAQGGNLLAYGARELANIGARSSGGVPLSEKESAMIDQRQYAQSQAEFRAKSIFARVFDAKDQRSVAGNFVDSTNLSPSKNLASLAALISNPGKIFSLFSSILNPKAHAATGYDWGFPRFGIPSSVLNDPTFANPYDNAKKVADLLDDPGHKDLIDRAKVCFGVDVAKDEDGNWGSVSTEDVNPNSSEYSDGDCGNLDDQNWRRMLLFIFDTRTMEAIDCYNSDSPTADQSCSNLKIGDANSSADSDSTATDAPITTGSQRELAKKLLKYKEEGKYKCDNDEDCDDLELMAAGKSISCSSQACKTHQACQATALDKRVLQVIIYLIDKNYKIGTYAFCRSHSKTTGVHDLGRAVDISSINGETLGDGATSKAKQLALEVDKALFDIKGDVAVKQLITGGVGATRVIDKAFVKYNRQAPGVEGAKAVAVYPDVVEGHTDHIHVGY